MLVRCQFFKKILVHIFYSPLAVKVDSKFNKSVLQFTYGGACQDDGQPQGNTQKYLEIIV